MTYFLRPPGPQVRPSAQRFRWAEVRSVFLFIVWRSRFDCATILVQRNDRRVRRLILFRMTFTGGVHRTHDIDVTTLGAGQECPQVPLWNFTLFKKCYPFNISKTVLPKPKVTEKTNAIRETMLCRAMC
jgi:hypothetical protein